MIGGGLIALVLVGTALFFGAWFRDSMAFADAHVIDNARTVRPTICTFKIDDFGGITKGEIRIRDGFMRFDIHDDKQGEITDWGIEVNMNDGSRMLSRASAQDSYVSLEAYPDLRVKILEDLRTIIKSEKLSCTPWWSGSSFRFELQPHI